MKPQTSRRARAILTSPMRRFIPLLKAAEAKGVQVLKLNIGDPDFSPPADFFKTIRSYRAKNVGYAPSAGLDSYIKAWQKYYRRFGADVPGNGIIPTAGSAEAILFALLAVADPGDDIIVFEPLYVSYRAFCAMAGINLVPVTLSIEDDFALPTAKVIESKITKKTRAIIVINPDNPSGKLWTDRELGTLISVAKKHGLFIVSDETYREFRFDGEKPQCLLARKDAREHVIVCDTLSKRFSMPGARIGCLATFHEGAAQAALKFAQARLSTGLIEQIAAGPLLEKGSPYIRKIVAEYERRRDVVSQGLQAIPGVEFRPARGAFYQIAKLPVTDAEDFVKFMVSDFEYKGKTVMVTPIRDFYVTAGHGADEIRIAYVLDVPQIRVALDILKRALARYREMHPTK